MDPKNRRQPVPAGGAPIPTALDAAHATPPAGESQPNGDQSNGDQSNGDQSYGDQSNDQGDGADRHEAEIVHARALIAFEGYEPNDLVEGSATEIERLELAGLVDPHPDAVAHVQAQG